MIDLSIDRREFLKIVLGGLGMTALEWSVFPVGPGAAAGDGEFDAVIIGAGLGGLSCAAAFARQGFRPVVLEQHTKAGGYATSFRRPGGFEFDVSLHSTVVGERNGIHNLIPGFPEIDDVTFVPHPSLYRAVFPDHDISVPQRNVAGYTDTLVGYFPAEEDGVRALFQEMRDFTNQLNGFVEAQSKGEVDMSAVPTRFPLLAKYSFSTWGAIVDAQLTDPKLKAIVSSLWGYYGLPPSRLASLYYAMPTIGYLEEGGCYPKGRSQTISNAFVNFIEKRGGRVIFDTRVEEILVENHAAHGVKTRGGDVYKGRVVISNADAFTTFRTMMKEEEYLKDYLARMDRYSVSLSCFQVFLGLKQDLVTKHGVTDSEIFVRTGYDLDADYQSALKADVENGEYGVMLYDNIFDGYSPEGKNTINILALQSYDHWKPYEADYRAGNKTAYNAEKERMADILIRRLESALLPGLADAIVVKEIGTPLTNVRYTGHHRGAIYGWDQTLDNSGGSRVGNKTPIENLYLAGAWSRPGHGYSAVVWSGLRCFGEIMEAW
jgi:phytoene dehydrogenase-like protein